jgi:hypothetical protein
LPGSLLMARALLLRSASLRGLGRYAQSAEDSASALQLWTAGAGAKARPSTFDPFRLEHARAQLALGDVTAAQLSLHALDQAAPGAAEGLRAAQEVPESPWRAVQRCSSAR